MRIIVSTILTILLGVCQAAPPEFWHHFSRKEGLSDSRIYGLAMDERGFIWAATHNGLNRFDGKQFKVYHSGNSALEGNTIWQIRQGPTHFLVLGTRYGLGILDTRTGIIRNRLNTVRPELMTYANNIRHVEYSARGEIIMGTLNGVYITDWEGNPVTSLEAGYDVNDIGIRRLHFSLGIAPFPNGDALLLTKAGYYYYDSRKKKIIPSKAFPDSLQVMGDFLSSYRESYVFEVDKQGRLFFIDHFAGIDSLFVLSSDHKQVRSFLLPFQVKNNIRWDSKIQFHDNNRISITTANEGYFTFRLDEKSEKLEVIEKRTAAHLFCQFLLKDEYGNIWLGTESGLYLGRAGPAAIHNISMLPFVEKNDYHPISAFTRHNGYLWVGGYSTHSGLMVLDSQYQLLKRIDIERSPVDKNFIISISPWNDDTLLLGTKFGAYFLDVHTYRSARFRLPYNSDSLSPIYIEKFFKSGKGEIWLSGGQTGGVWRINTSRDSIFHIRPGHGPANFPMRNAGAMAEDRDGNIWMVHWVDGIARWNAAKQRFDSVKRRWPFLPSGQFDCSGIVIDSRDNFWFFINGYGLVRYDPVKDFYQKQFATSDQADDNASSLLLVEDSLLWMNLRHSILIYNMNSGQVHAMTSQNGLPVGSNYSGTLYYDKPGSSVLAGFSNQLTLIPLAVGDGWISPQQVFITGVYQPGNQDPLDFLKPLKLSSHHADLRVEFALPDFHFNLPISQFEYRLNESEPWNEIGNASSINLVNLGPGNYHLQIRMAGMGTADAGKAGLYFYVAPAFYQTAWFYVACMALAAFLLYLIYRYKIGQLKKIASMREKIALDLHDDLGSRLTNIRFLSVMGEDDATPDIEKKKFLRKISEEAAASGEALDDIVNDIQEQQEELDDLAAKMRRYASELFDEDPVAFKMEVADNLQAGKMSAGKKSDLFLSFKEILTNIRKHSGATTVTVRMGIRGKNLVLEVCDNGIGIRNNGSNGSNGRNGLRSLNNRMLRWKGEVQIISGSDGGTEIRLSIPVDADSHIKRIFFR